MSKCVPNIELLDEVSGHKLPGSLAERHVSKVYCQCCSSPAWPESPSFGLKWLWLHEIVGQAKAIFHGLALAWPGPGHGFCTYDNNNKCIQRINESRYATQTNRLCPHHPHQLVYHPTKAPQHLTQVSLNPHLKHPPTLHQALQIPILIMVQVLKIVSHVGSQTLCTAGP